MDFMKNKRKKWIFFIYIILLMLFLFKPRIILSQQCTRTWTPALPCYLSTLSYDLYSCGDYTYCRCNNSQTTQEYYCDTRAIGGIIHCGFYRDTDTYCISHCDFGNCRAAEYQACNNSEWFECGFVEPTVTPRPTNTPTPTITPTPLANLTMGTLTRAPTCSKVGNSMTFSGVITNNGAGGTGVGFKARLEIDYNQDGTYDFTAPLNSVSALNSMASTTTTFTNAWTAIVGDHRFRICADKPDNDVTETDETIADNCQSQNFSVTEKF